MAGKEPLTKLLAVYTMHRDVSVDGVRNLSVLKRLLKEKYVSPSD
jgi:hypothetical protein